MSLTSDETSHLLSQNSNRQVYHEPDLSSTEQGEESKKLSSYLVYVNAFLPSKKRDELKTIQVVPMAFGIFLTALDATIVVSCEFFFLYHRKIPFKQDHTSVCGYRERSKGTPEDKLDSYIILAYLDEFPVRRAPGLDKSVHF